MDRTFGLESVRRKFLRKKGLLQFCADPDQLRFTPEEIRTAIRAKLLSRQLSKLKRRGRKSYPHRHQPR